MMATPNSPLTAILMATSTNPRASPTTTTAILPHSGKSTSVPNKTFPALLSGTAPTMACSHASMVSASRFLTPIASLFGNTSTKKHRSASKSPHSTAPRSPASPTPAPATSSHSSRPTRPLTVTQVKIQAGQSPAATAVITTPSLSSAPHYPVASST